MEKTNLSLNRQVKNAPKKELFTPHAYPYVRARNSPSPEEIYGQLNFMGVYNKCIVTIQNDRYWERDYCLHNDDLIIDYIAPAFQDIPFCELTEYDFLTRWEKLIPKIPSKSKRAECCKMIRLVVEYAYAAQYTVTTLWGVPELSETAKTARNNANIPAKIKALMESNAKEAEGIEAATRGLRIAHSMPLTTEFFVARYLLLNYKTHREFLAGLCMLFCGTRTSEGIAFKFGDLVYNNGRLGLVLHETAMKDSRETKSGGKTANAPRILPLPMFFANLLLDEKHFLQTLFPDEDIDQFPIGCRGVDYKTPCTAAELNAALKEAFKNAYVLESMIATAYEDMRLDPAVAADCEKSVVAMLFRHQFASAAVYCGFTEAQICKAMGHKLEDEASLKTDFVNPDNFLELAEKMDRRPLVQVLSNLPMFREHSFAGSLLDISSDRSVSIAIDSAGPFTLNVFPREGSSPLAIHCSDGISIERTDKLLMPQFNNNITLSNAQSLWAQGDSLKYLLTDDAPSHDHILVESAPSVIDVWDSFDKWSSASLSLNPQWKNERPLGDNPEELFTAFKRTAIQPAPLKPVAQPTVPVPCINSEPISDSANEMAVAPSLAKSNSSPLQSQVSRNTPPRQGLPLHPLYLVHKSGEIMSLNSDSLGIKPRSRAGNYLCENIKNSLVQAFSHDSSRIAYILSRNGMLYQVPQLACLDTVTFQENHPECIQALKTGGFLLQPPLTDSTNVTITCLGENGDVIKVAVPSFKRNLLNGKQLIQLNGRQLASACISTEDEDILLISKKGKALRLASSSLIAKGPGCQLIQGIKLDTNDTAVACIPYSEHKPYLVVTLSGKVLRLKNNATIQPHGRRGTGEILWKSRGDDGVFTIMEANEGLLLATSSGKGLCICVDDIPEYNKHSGGVMAIKTGEYHVVCALPLEIKSPDFPVN